MVSDGGAFVQITGVDKAQITLNVAMSVAYFVRARRRGRSSGWWTGWA